MVYLVVRKVPTKFTLQILVKQLAKIIKGNFEAINFVPAGATKTCYLKLSAKLDPYQVMDSVNKLTRFRATITHDLPNIPQSKKSGMIPLKTRIALRIPSEETPVKVFISTHKEIFVEMQMKYSGLIPLSRKTDHKLLDGIARTIFERLKIVADGFPDALATGFKLSGAYRRSHPHFGDFQLILTTLHKLQDAAGAQRLQLSENDLIQVAKQPNVIENVPYNKVQSASSKYSDRIAKKIAEHVAKLNSEIESEDTEDEIARKKVRKELKKLTPYMPLIIREVISNHFLPRKGPFQKVRIYGEPFMPNKDVMAPVIKKHRAVSIMRSDRMFNLLRLNIPLQQFSALMAMDGTVIGGAKLVIRSSDLQTHSVPRELVKKMHQVFGVHSDDAEALNDAPEDEDYEEMEM